MSWWGKAAGGALGFAVLGPLGALVGAAVGHGFDRGMSEELARKRPQPAVYPFRETLLDATFSTMGYLASVDGRVSVAEKQAARRVMGELQLEPIREREAWRSFERGASSGFKVDTQLYRLGQVSRGRRELIRAFMDMQMHVALAEGSMSGSTRVAIRAIASRLGLSPLEFTQTETIARLRSGARKAARLVTPDDPLQQAYLTLGIDSAADEAAVKKAYRRLISRHHPDKIASQQPSEDALARARARTHEIRQAYETIMGAARR